MVISCWLIPNPLYTPPARGLPFYPSARAGPNLSQPYRLFHQRPFFFVIAFQQRQLNVHAFFMRLAAGQKRGGRITITLHVRNVKKEKGYICASVGNGKESEGGDIYFLLSSRSLMLHRGVGWWVCWVLARKGRTGAIREPSMGRRMEAFNGQGEFFTTSSQYYCFGASHLIYNVQEEIGWGKILFSL